MSSNGDRRVVKLRHPVKDEVEERTIEELRFRAGRFGDLKGLRFQFGTGAVPVEFDDLMTVASRLSGERVEIIAKLEGQDLAEVVRLALDFYLSFLMTGETGSESSPTT